MIQKIKDLGMKYRKQGTVALTGLSVLALPAISFAYTLPTPDATTSAQFDALGLSYTSIYGVFATLASTSVSFGLWLVQVAWPFLLIVGFIFLMWRLAHRFTGFGR
jgi:hypothetical protein